ncbi:hypothetical protein C8R42DRAFT_779865 [Lentinula raphanica]|nr:hypothetical protein C8R42DRAFT_779865 [Lentinula raphanica]
MMCTTRASKSPLTMASQFLQLNAGHYILARHSHMIFSFLLFLPSCRFRKIPRTKSTQGNGILVGLGTIRFSSMQEKINVFKVLHDHLPYLASISDGNNSLFLDNIVRLIELLSSDKEKIKEMGFNQILWYGMLKAMEEVCGTGSGFPLSELECHHAEHHYPSLPQPEEPRKG